MVVTVLNQHLYKRTEPVQAKQQDKVVTLCRHVVCANHNREICLSMHLRLRGLKGMIFSL